MTKVTAGLLATFAAACGFGGHSGADAGPKEDGGADGARCVSWEVIEAGVNPCMGLGEPVVLDIPTAGPNATFDTATGILSHDGQTRALPGTAVTRTGLPPLRVVNLQIMKLGKLRTLNLVGDHAVLFVVHGDVLIEGDITASASLPAQDGSTGKAPGADFMQCMTTGSGGDGIASDNSGNSGGGAGGGGWGAPGAVGGNGFGSRMGGSLGAAVAANLPLRGGCPGGQGGDEDSGGVNQGGRGGGGGGAFAISAYGMITISSDSVLSANGAPGRGAAIVRSGGGGGGSGGTIVLDGQTLVLQGTATFCAKGGSGGEGSSNANAGEAGSTVICNAVAAPGGSGGSNSGGDGGAGGTAGAPNGVAGDNGGNNAGGGGGGGGVGKILLKARGGALTVGPARFYPPFIQL